MSFSVKKDIVTEETTTTKETILVNISSDHATRQIGSTMVSLYFTVEEAKELLEKVSKELGEPGFLNLKKGSELSTKPQLIDNGDKGMIMNFGDFASGMTLNEVKDLQERLKYYINHREDTPPIPETYELDEVLNLSLRRGKGFSKLKNWVQHHRWHKHERPTLVKCRLIDKDGKTTLMCNQEGTLKGDVGFGAEWVLVDWTAEDEKKAKPL